MWPAIVASLYIFIIGGAFLFAAYGLFISIRYEVRYGCDRDNWPYFWHKIKKRFSLKELYWF